MSARTKLRNLLEIVTSKIKQLDYAFLIFMKVKKNVCIPLTNGTNLRADLFTPLGKGTWPVVINAYPYQKDGLGAMFTTEAYYLLKAGYAVLMADLRGTGASDGVSQDPFDGLRGDDLYALVEWSANQKWSNGKVGMEGISYGGLTALRAAAENPPSLKAVYASMAPTAFYDSIALPGGSMSMLGVLGSWLNLMNLINLFPPLYIKNRPDWQAAWKERLDSYTPYLFHAAENITYNEYWKKIEISVENIRVPTFVLEGWRGFSYREGFQLYQRLRVAKKLLIGPWVHIWPSLTDVEPINYVNDMVRWFDYWLKGRDNGITKEPPLSIYVMGGGFWKYEHEWLPPGAKKSDYYLHSDGSLETEVDNSAKTVGYAHDPGVGTTAGLMCLFALGIDYPREQSQDNLRSLIFDTPVLLDTVEIVGEPMLTLTLSSDMADAAITAKLCDIAPDGQSALVTHGWLRLSRRDSLEYPAQPEPGEEYEIRLKLWPTDYQLRAGHRLRLCLALSDFPHIFPLPYVGDIRLPFGQAHVQKLTLYTLTDEAQAGAHPKFMAPDLSLFRGLKPSIPKWEVYRDEATKQVTVHAGTEMELSLPYLDSPMKLTHFFDATLTEGQPKTAVLDATARAEFALVKHRYVFKARQVVTSDRAEVSARIEEDGSPTYDKVLSKALNWVSLGAE
jgi:putative CocE/NonD family hydrolase